MRNNATHNTPPHTQTSMYIHTHTHTHIVTDVINVLHLYVKNSDLSCDQHDFCLWCWRWSADWHQQHRNTLIDPPPTGDDVSIAIFHAVLILFGRIPGSRLSLEETLKDRRESWSGGSSWWSSEPRDTSVHPFVHPSGWNPLHPPTHPKLSWARHFHFYF